MDKACEGDETRALVAALGATPAVPPKSSRKEPETTTRESTGFATKWSGCSGG